MKQSKEVSTIKHKTMSHIRSKDTGIEVKLRKAMWSKGYRYRKNYNKLPGKPDVVLTKYRIAIFCDSEFFHGKDWNDVLLPKLQKGNNSEYWEKKIQRNIERDVEINRELQCMGWIVLRFWGKEIEKNMDGCVKTIEETIFDLKMAAFESESDED